MIPQRLLQAAALAGLLFASACSSTRESAIDREAGFLSDYGRLSSNATGGGDNWVDPEFSLHDYDNLYLPAVEIWLSEANQASISTESASKLAQLYHDQAVEKLRDQGWAVVASPGRRTAIVRLSLTELESPNAVGSILTSVPLISTLAIQVTAATADINVFVGEASTEVQIIEATTGKILAEARDRRVGAHTLLNMGSSWADVEDIIDIWTTRLGDGFAKM